MGMDSKLTGKGVELRKATSRLMEENLSELNDHVDKTAFPFFLTDKFKNLGVGGLSIKGYGSPGLDLLDSSALVYEIAKYDGSFMLALLADTCLGMAVINELADEEQKQRWLPPAIKFEKFICFGLTEPLHGSDATGL